MAAEQLIEQLKAVLYRHPEALRDVVALLKERLGK
jgi:hypothetical protein